jgi:prefoldin subunit 5
MENIEESKTTNVIITIGQASQITDKDVKEYFGDDSLYVTLVRIPKGYKVTLDAEKAKELLEKEHDTLKEENVNFVEDDPHCTIYIKGITGLVNESDLNAAFSNEGKI